MLTEAAYELAISAKGGAGAAGASAAVKAMQHLGALRRELDHLRTLGEMDLVTDHLERMRLARDAAERSQSHVAAQKYDAQILQEENRRAAEAEARRREQLLHLSPDEVTSQLLSELQDLPIGVVEELLDLLRQRIEHRDHDDPIGVLLPQGEQLLLDEDELLP